MFSACDVNNSSGDDYTPAKTIALSEISIMIPETYMASSANSSTDIEYTNDFGGGSVEITKDALDGKTQQEVYNGKITLATYSESTDTITMLNHEMFVIEENIGNLHRLVHYIFIHNNSVYTITFGWSIEKEINSRKAMEAMLETLVIL